jgi:hypothetical protein
VIRAYTRLSTVEKTMPAKYRPDVSNKVASTKVASVVLASNSNRRTGESVHPSDAIEVHESAGEMGHGQHDAIRIVGSGYLAGADADW